MATKEAKQRTRIQVDSTYDIETEDWDKFVIGGQYTAQGHYQETQDLGELARWLLKPGMHWAHNGGKFDALAIIDVWRDMGLSVNATLAGGRIISAKCGKAQLCDSAALWPERLKEITSGQKDAKEELPWKCVCEDDCGGYCQIRRKMPRKMLRQLAGYLRADCVSLFEALAKLQDFADAHDMDLGLTIGGSAFRNAKRLLGFDTDEHNLDEHWFRRGAYYGGRVQTFNVGRYENGNTYDVVSMYPYQLSTLELPCGNPREVFGKAARRSFDAGKDGVYRVNVTVPECHIPPLPFRDKKRLHYPVGTWEATYTGLELRGAIALADVKINSFRDARVYDRSEKIFGSWVDHIIRLRMEAGKKTPFGLFLKRYMNSVYGKLSARPDKLRILINPPDIKEGDEIIADGVIARKSQSIDACSHPVWAAMVTSAARLKLYQKMHERKPENVLYCDTDGIMCLDSRDDGVGEKLGAWECEGFSEVNIIAPKVYGLNRPGGKTEHKAKGIRLKKGEAAEAGKRYKLGAAIKGAKTIGSRDRFFRKNESTRVLNQRTGDRFLKYKSGGETRPPMIEECYGK